MQKYWRNIGRVTVHAYNNSKGEFNTLADAVRWLGEKRVNQITDGRLGSFWVSDSRPDYSHIKGDFKKALWANSGWVHISSVTDYIIHDENDLRIPAWRIKEEWKNLPWKIDPRFHRWHNFGYKRNYHRRFRPFTFGNLKTLEAAQIDLEELEDYHITVKVHHHSGCFDNWDEEYGRSCYRVKSWKRHRRTQYKTVDKSESV